MKQRIVFNIPMSCDEDRKKAMKLASQIKGVRKVEVENDMKHLVVVGKGIDSVKLANSLRKKFCFANLVTIHNASSSSSSSASHPQPSFHYQPPNNYYYFYDPNPPNPCTIM